MCSMKIDKVTKSQLAQVLEIEQQVYKDDGYSKYFFRQAFDCWGEYFYVAYYEDEISGYAMLSPSSKDSEQLWVLSVAVSPKYQGKGIAKALMRHAISNRGEHKQLMLTVSPENKVAYNLYNSLGFVLVAQEDDYYGVNEARDVLALSFA